MTSKLWGGRFSQKTASDVDAFNASVPFDYKLWPYDIAGSIAAYRRAGGRVVTVAVNSFQFHKPVFVGDLISCYAEVERVGRTSLTVHVEVYAERSRGVEEVLKVTEATLTYVAVGTDRKPRPVDGG